MSDEVSDELRAAILKLSVMAEVGDQARRVEVAEYKPRQGHHEPPSDDEVAAFEVWRAAFEPLFKEGERRGWFRDGDEMDPFEITPPEGRWVWDK